MIETEQIDLMFKVIGSPFNNDANILTEIPSSNAIDDLFDLSFKNRVGLLFLQRCIELGIPLSETGKRNYQKLNQRREDTEDMLIKLTRTLDAVYEDQWVMFKTVKPFPSTPNDTDWFPFNIKDHKWLCEHLLNSGFTFLEEAPLQTTLIDESGVGQAHSDKRGGVWYIDCYRAPGADYFKYLDTAKLKCHFTRIEIKGSWIPILKAPAELIAICFHNVFPERTYSIESFYLILHYLKEINKEKKGIEDFLSTVHENHTSQAVYANLIITASLHQHHFGYTPELINYLLAEFSHTDKEALNLEKNNFTLPYNFTNTCFWRCFFEKLKDPVSLKSLFIQGFHMLNPIFLWGVIKILKQRLSGQGIYEQH